MLWYRGGQNLSVRVLVFFIPRTGTSWQNIFKITTQRLQIGGGDLVHFLCKNGENNAQNRLETGENCQIVKKTLENIIKKPQKKNQTDL